MLHKKIPRRYRLIFSTVFLVFLIPSAIFLAKNAARILGALGGSTATPLAYWSLDEGTDDTCPDGDDVCDGSGNGYTAPQTGAHWRTAENCISGSCLEFDGTGYSSYVYGFGMASSGNVGTITVSTWMRSTTTDEGADGIVGKYMYTGTSRGWRIMMSGGVAAWQYHGVGCTSDSVTGTTPIDDGQWHFIVATRTTSSMKLYVDGNLEGTDESIACGAAATSASDVYLGKGRTGLATNHSENFKGFIDEVKIFNAELTEKQILAEYQAGAAALGGGPQSYAFINQNLESYWPMDETSGDAADRTIFARTLTNNGTTTYATGKFGNSSVHVPASSQYFSYTSAINNIQTISMWIKPDSTTNYLGCVGTDRCASVTSGSVDQSGLEDHVEIFTESGNWTAPAGVSSVTVRAWGGGGAAGGYSGIGASSGGGGGAFAQTTLTVSPGITYPYTIGARVNGTTGAGSDGNPTYWADGTQLYADPGEGGANALNNPGAGGQASESIGTTKYSGGSGHGGVGASNSAGGGGSAAASDSDGNPGSNSTGGAAVSEYDGKGGNGVANPSLGSGAAGNNYGGGGGGGRTSASVSGGAGAQGIMDIAYTIPNSTQVYVNGERDGTLVADQWQHVIITSDYPIDTQTFTLGQVGSYYYDGQFDDVRLYSRKLNPSEIVKLYTWTPDPVVYYNLDQNAGTSTVTDNSGNSNTATMTGSIPESAWTPAQFGSGLTFDGTDDALTVATASDANVDFAAGEAFSGAVWVKISSMPGVSEQDAIITKWDETSTLRSYRLVVENDDADTTGNFQIELYDESADESLITTTATDSISENTWYHLAFTYNGGIAGAAGDLVLFLNGTKIAENSLNASFLGVEDTATDFSIGDYDTTDAVAANTAFTGILDDIKIYNYQRLPAQIIEDLNAGHPLGGSPIGSHVAYWNFDELSGTTANDASINNNHLTLSTASWDPEGRFNGAFIADGATYLSRTDDPDFDVAAADDYTLSVWFKSSSASNPGSTEYLVTKSAAITAGYALYLNTSGQACFGIDDDTSWGPDVASCSSADIYDATWHHLLAVRDTAGDRILLYVDGSLVDSDTDPTTATLENSLSLYLADRDGANNGDEFVGLIDEVKVYRAALSADQAKLVANAGATVNFGTGVSESALSMAGAGNPPIGYWKFDENQDDTCPGGSNDICDQSGAGNDGTLSGTTWTTGKFGSGLLLNGSSDYISIADPASGSFTDTQGSISLWFNKASTTEKVILMNRAVYSGTTGIELYTGPSGALSFRGSSDTAITSSTSIYSIDSWHHLVVTYSGTSANMYLDGILIASGSISTVAASTDPLVSAYSSPTPSGFYFDGLLDELKIFDYALTPAQVAYDYNRGAPFAWYNFDDCTGTTIYNYSLNANDEAMGSNGTLDLGSGGTTSAGTCTTSGAWYNGRTGKLNYSLDFDGNDDVVSVSNASIIDQNEGLQNGLTIATWVYANSDGESDVGRIFTKNTNTWCRTDSQGTTDLDLECSLDLSTDATLNIADALTTNTWHHIALAWTNDGDDEITIYVDGIARGTSTDGVGDASADTATLYIGGSNTAASNTAAFDGQLDDFRIFPYELSATQIKKVMLGGTTGSSVRFGE